MNCCSKSFILVYVVMYVFYISIAEMDNTTRAFSRSSFSTEIKTHGKHSHYKIMTARTEFAQ